MVMGSIPDKVFNPSSCTIALVNEMIEFVSGMPAPESG
jgi:hypothetical protein